MLLELAGLNYRERLNRLEFISLKRRILRVDVIEVYKGPFTFFFPG